jgi:colanic acid/amylovoran biosynthesis glycosyltransferase
MMRIAYVCNRYPALSNTFIMREVRALRRLGLEIDVLSLRRPSVDHLLAEADREEYRRTSFILPLLTRPRRYLGTLAAALRLAPPGPKGTIWQLFYFAEAGLVWDRCRKRDIHHLHAHFAYVASDVALLAARLGGWTWSFSMHGPPEFYAVGTTRLAEKVRDADAVICISDFCRSQLMGLVEPEAWDKLRVVHCGVSVADFAGELPSRNGTRGIEVLMVGRVVPVKGHPVLIEALAELRRRGVDARATIVGEGAERANLERMAQRFGVEDRVLFTGAVGQDDIRAHYARADVFCLPSFAEGLPVVAMEAMAMGLPVVSTRIMGIPEVVEHGVTGLLVPPARHDLLADALEQLAGDAELRAVMGRAGREKAEAEFDADDSAAQLREIYGALM